MSKQTDAIFKACNKSDQILCLVAATEESVSLMKKWIFEEVSCLLYKEDLFPNKNIIRFSFNQDKIKNRSKKSVV